MAVKRIGRRQFLMGSGGAMLAIPFLGSLLPRGSKAQAPNQKFFVGMMSQHGGVWPEYMYPTTSVLDQSFNLYSDHQARYGRIPRPTSGGNVDISRVLNAPESRLPQSVLDKMMIIQGLDVSFYIQHHTAGALGNYERRDLGDDTSLYVPTIDQVLAAWDGFYTPGDGKQLGSMHVGGRMSWNQTGSGVGEVPPAPSPQVLFNLLFGEYEPSESGDTPPASGRTHVLNRVVEHYNRLSNGTFGDSRRLSKNDKARLDDHMDMLSEIARNEGSVIVPSEGCDPSSADRGNFATGYDFSENYSQMRQWYQDFNAVFAAAIACGASRVATVFSENTWHPSASYWTDYSEWHIPIPHEADRSREHWSAEKGSAEHPQDILVTAKNNFFKDCYMDLVNRLNAIDAGDGTKVLDKGLVMWAQESGPVTHNSDSTPIVTAGGAGDFFNTGYYYDLRNLNAVEFPYGNDVRSTALHQNRRAGILYNQWLSNVLQSMGMPSSAFQRSHTKGWAGYGHAERAGELTGHYPDRLFNDANKKITRIVKGA